MRRRVQSEVQSECRGAVGDGSWGCGGVAVAVGRGAVWGVLLGFLWWMVWWILGGWMLVVEGGANRVGV